MASRRFTGVKRRYWALLFVSTISFHSLFGWLMSRSDQKDELKALQDVVAACMPSADVTVDCFDVAYQMLCEFSALGRRHGFIWAVAHGTLLSLQRNGQLFADDHDMDILYLEYQAPSAHDQGRRFLPAGKGMAGTGAVNTWNDLVAVGYKNNRQGTGLILDMRHPGVRERFGAKTLDACTRTAFLQDGIEWWRYIPLDRSGKRVSGPPEEFRNRGAIIGAYEDELQNKTSPERCMNHRIETFVPDCSTNTRSVRSPTGEVRWQIPFPNYPNSLFLDVAYGPDWRKPGKVHANHYMNNPHHCGNFGAKCDASYPEELVWGGCPRLNLSNYDAARVNLTGLARMEAG